MAIDLSGATTYKNFSRESASDLLNKAIYKFYHPPDIITYFCV